MKRRSYPQVRLKRLLEAVFKSLKNDEREFVVLETGKRPILNAPMPSCLAVETPKSDSRKNEGKWAAVFRIWEPFGFELWYGWWR